MSNRGLRSHVASYLPGYTPRQMTYDLRRLRRNGFLARIGGTNRYQLTSEGRSLAVFFAKTYARVIAPSLAELDPSLPAEIAARSALARGWRSFAHALEAKIADAALAA